jgi:folate-binding protein YgfZ
MPTIQLSNRSLILIEGPDAEHFLQNILTTDLEALSPGDLKPGALLSPQGKILFDFLIARSGVSGFILDCRTDLADDFVKRLTLYKLRAKAQISKQDQADVFVRWEIDSAPSDVVSTIGGDAWLRDSRFPQALRVARSYANGISSDTDLEEWTQLRIAYGVAESGSDFEAGDAFPHDVLLDQTGGVGFRKGCYIGQEVVSRMQHRGTARRRVMVATSDSDLPASGTEVRANDRPIGVLGSVAGRSGIAIMRIDRVRDALDAGHSITANDRILSLAIPPAVTYELPQSTAGTEEA